MAYGLEGRAGWVKEGRSGWVEEGRSGWVEEGRSGWVEEGRSGWVVEGEAAVPLVAWGGGRGEPLREELGEGELRSEAKLLLLGPPGELWLVEEVSGEEGERRSGRFWAEERLLLFPSCSVAILRRSLRG